MPDLITQSLKVTEEEGDMERAYPAVPSFEKWGP